MEEVNEREIKQNKTEVKKNQTENKNLEAKLGSNQNEIRVEVENGILGVKRDILMSLIDLMIFRENSLIRNLIGMSGESVCWINHFHFIMVRTLCKRHLERHIIPSKRKRGKEITIEFKNIIFILGWNVGRSMLINILIKNTILECTIKINKDTKSWFYVGICTPKQVNDVVVNCLGMKDCGCCFCFRFSFSDVWCSGKSSPYLKEGGIKKEEEITAVVNNKNVHNKEKQGKMNIIRNQKRVPHTIVNIPTKDGVHLGFSCSDGSVILSIISLIHLSVLPFNDGMRCIAYDFIGGFKDESYNLKDEEGKEIPNIRREYYLL